MALLLSTVHGVLLTLWYMLSRAAGFALSALLLVALFWCCLRPATASHWQALIWLAVPLYAVLGLLWGAWLGLGRVWEQWRGPLAEPLGRVLARREARVEQLAGAFADQPWLVRWILGWVLSLPDISAQLVEVTEHYRACPEKNGPLSQKVAAVLVNALPFAAPAAGWLGLVFLPLPVLCAYLAWG